MKEMILAALLLTIFASPSFCQKDEHAVRSSETPKMTKVEISDGSNSMLTVANFIKIKNYILSNGLTRTYSQMYSNNPYYGFGNINAYLNPDSGQNNINCDRSKSDFNHLVIQTSTTPYAYWNVTWDRERNRLIIQQAWTEISPTVLTKEVEDIIRQILMEIDNK